MAEVQAGAATVRVNGEVRAVRSQGIRDLLCELNLNPDGRGVAVAVNDEVVPRGDWERVAIRPGDRIEIVGASQGG